MSSTNKTEHYNLPQFVTSDKPSWLTDENAAMVAIDAAMFANSQAAAQAATLAGTAKAAADNALSVADGAVDMAEEIDRKVGNIGVREISVATSSGQSALLAQVRIGNNVAYSVSKLIAHLNVNVGPQLYTASILNGNPFNLPVIVPVIGTNNVVRIGLCFPDNSQTIIEVYYDGTRTVALYERASALTTATPLASPLFQAGNATVTLTAIPE